jgi:hypothetical protein
VTPPILGVAIVLAGDSLQPMPALDTSPGAGPEPLTW